MIQAKLKTPALSQALDSLRASMVQGIVPHKIVRRAPADNPINLSQVQNLTAILEAKFRYFHAGPKFWKQSLKLWEEFDFRSCLAAILKMNEQIHDPTWVPDLFILTKRIEQEYHGW